MSASTALPRWDLEIVFPALDSPEYRRAFEEIGTEAAALESQYDRLGVDKDGKATLADLESVLCSTNAFYERLSTLCTYVGCLVTTDTRNEEALAAESELDGLLATVRKLGKRLTAWLGGLDGEAAAKSSATAEMHAYAIRRAQIEATHLMDPALEELASDMELTGGVAWSKLYNNVSSQIMVPVELEGKVETLPMSALAELSSSPSRDVRRAAYEAGLAAWEANEVPLAAAMNGCKGEVLLLAKRRGWGSPLDESCHHAGIDRQTLDAMMEAAHESFPTFRRYFRAKAKKLGIERLAFYDLFAPIATDGEAWTFSDAERFVVERFGGFSTKLATYAQRAFDERWIDAEARAGKVGGAYCAPLRKDESRILMNFRGSYDSVRTLAHELGHGYHNVCLDGRTPLQKETPATLAETASIFCETIVKEGVLESGTDDEKLVALEGALTGAAQVVVDITSRFLFESRLLDLRSKREASAREMCELMVQAQKDTYGDGLDEDRLHPYMWAVKPHYYGSSFYNYPYMFGLLFGLGLYSVYRQEGESFKARYDDLLSSTGMADAATLAQRFGFDLRTPAFWRSSLEQVARDVERFESLAKL